MDKHIINDPRTVATESLRGLVTSRSDLEFEETYRIVKRGSETAVPISKKVQIVSGGGSGHEPSFAGMVGTGLLDAAVCGNVFASPNVGQIRRGVELVSKNDDGKDSMGVLMIIMRYTGDVLQFALTLEHSLSTNPSLPISLLVVGDDVAVTRTQGTIVGRRGLAGTVLVHKIAGAMAEQGESLEAIKTGIEGFLDRIGTCGVGMGHCNVPGSRASEESENGASEPHLGSDQVEIGMGIHNEPGVLTTTLDRASDLVPKLVQYITSTQDEERSFVPFQHDGKDEVVLLVNNLGGISQVEMGLIAREATLALETKGIRVRRTGVGSYMTSLNLPGFSLTTLLLPRGGEHSSTLSSDRILELLDAPANASGWIPLQEPRDLKHCLISSPREEKASAHVQRKGTPIPFGSGNAKLFQRAVQSACESVIAAEPEITRYDTIAGDGDCGTCLKAGAEEIMKAQVDGLISEEDVPSAVLGLAEAMERAMDGTSGALYSITFNALAAGFAKQDITTPLTAEMWSIALSHALESLYKYTNARPPSRTLVDPLDAFVQAFARDQDLQSAILQATEAAEKTKDLVAKAGRAAYVGQDALKDRQVPDPGAWGVVKILEGLQRVLLD